MSPTMATEVGRRTRLNRLYASYAADPAFAHMLPHTSGVVPGDGPTRPRLVFVGEAPGANEDKHRKPFIGASGRFLNELLDSVGLARSEVFITNVVKIRPVTVRGGSRRGTLANRPPTDGEKEASIPYVRKEMRILGLPPIVVLGKHAKSVLSRLPERGYNLGDPGLSMKLGVWTTALGVPMLPLHHPAYGLYQQANRPMMFEMFKQVLNAPQGWFK